MESIGNRILDHLHHLSEEDIKRIIRKYTSCPDDIVMDDYMVHHASNKMLGFLGDYWKLQVKTSLENGKCEIYHFFIKVISKSNAAKADMVREMKLFQKEIFFHNVLNDRLDVPGLKPWSAKFVTTIDEGMVFEDLNALQYRVRNKFERFDMAHTLQILSTLARFHTSSIILEEKKSKILGRPYIIQVEYEQFLTKGGYHKDDSWFQQCMEGALQAVEAFSKYGRDETLINVIRANWRDVWCSSLNVGDISQKYRNVICHRDLWNNNILFHYKKLEDSMVPDDCVMVDFAAVRCQPPASDVMLVLYCNLDPKFREENLTLFLNHYYNELKLNLSNFDIDIENIEKKDKFFESAEEQRLWGIVVCACLLPQFWIDDDLMTEIFTDTAKFNDILSNDKGAFIKEMMETNVDYKEKVIEIFDEIIERYCLHASD